MGVDDSWITLLIGKVALNLAPSGKKSLKASLCMGRLVSCHLASQLMKKGLAAMARRTILIELTVSSKDVIAPLGIPHDPARILKLSSRNLGRVPSLNLDQTYPPEFLGPSGTTGFGAEQPTVLIRGEIDEDYLDALRRQPQVIGVWYDAPIQPFTNIPNYSLGLVDCDDQTPKGNLTTVANYLGCDWFWNQGYRGAGMVIAICDAGVNLSKLPVSGGWSPNGATPPGHDDDIHEHGSMCAFDALGIAPESRFYDVGVLKQPQPPQASTIGWASTAIQGYNWIITTHANNGTPQVVSNSWGLYCSKLAPDYANDPRHPLTRKVIAAINMGIFVVFAAGNCGDGCPAPHPYCQGEVGPRRSIWGANGHPMVMTVGAANMNGEWIGYSSQGPSSLNANKPDVCAPSHYQGYTQCDSGTSAACPICAGVMALMRQAYPSLDFATVKDIIKRTALASTGHSWHHCTGFGMLNARAAFQAGGQAFP